MQTRSARGSDDGSGTQTRKPRYLTPDQGPVVRKVDSVIRRIAIFLNSLKLFIYWYKPD